MQSLIHAHLPADIVLCSVQAADKPPIVVSETHANTHSHSHRSKALLQTPACTSKTGFSFSTNRLSKGFYRTVSTVCFLFSIGMSSLWICRPLTTGVMRGLSERQQIKYHHATKRGGSNKSPFSNVTLGMKLLAEAFIQSFVRRDHSNWTYVL